MSLRNIQILLETATRCGGNCSGCALSSFERMADIELDQEKLNKYKQITSSYLEKYDIHELESVSLFLGQGDHFLMDIEYIDPFVKFCSELVPNELKHKTVVFITASAIGKHEHIKEKMDLFYEASLKYEIPFFIQVVFDPKKMISSSFKETYIKNILYFKEKCGMTEFTINLGNDLFESISPQDFHDLVSEYKIKHVEMNWVINSETKKMWVTHYKTMFSWLKEWLIIAKEDKQYEINFIPFVGRAFLKNNISFSDLSEHIYNSLIDNLYIDTNYNYSLGQMGIISNITPVKERLTKYETTQKFNVEQMAKKESNTILRKILKNKSCIDCEYKNICALSGSTMWFDYSEGNEQCPWDIKDFLIFFENNFVLNNKSSLGNTIFDKNPVQHSLLIQDKNATHQFFEDKI